MDLTLVIMAAGMGSRFGGMKQVEPIGPNGEILMEYSIYDAKQAGFNKVVFIIKEDMLEVFREKIGSKIEKMIDTEYVFQKMDLPNGYKSPENRTKPWGTAQAVLSCKDSVNNPFAVINADDYYGRKTFEVLADFLNEKTDAIIEENSKSSYCMAAFYVKNTLTENGHVSRGVCQVSEQDLLLSVEEHLKIQKEGNKIISILDDNRVIYLEDNTPVSMNAWGFTPEFFTQIEDVFPQFYQDAKENLEKAEFYLPFVVDTLIKDNKADITVLKSDEKWYGLTYKEDREVVQKALTEKHADNKYPSPLF